MQSLAEQNIAVASEPAAPAAIAAAETSDRVDYTLDQLQRLADLLAVEDGYEPVVREFAVPPQFKLSIVIPVFNEARTIRQVIAKIAALPVPKEIIIIDDASTDGTREVLKEFECARDVHVIYKPHNEGKGAALRTGFRCVSGGVVVIQDADLEYDPRDILPVIQPIVGGQADVVYGSRYLNEQPEDRSFIHRAGNYLLTSFSNWTTGLALTDMETCYKAFRREVLQSFDIEQPRFGFEPEITAKIARRKWRLFEVPIRYAPRGYAEGKKIGVGDLVSTLACIIRYWLCK